MSFRIGLFEERKKEIGKQKMEKRRDNTETQRALRGRSKEEKRFGTVRA
jgi:hypothetical protein